MKPTFFVLGTGNRKKCRELAELLTPVGVAFRTLADFGKSIEVVEDGVTFSENARKKASQQARHLGQWVLAEDSGLCVDALSGAPGVYSARFSGEHATDDRNNRLLLEKLGDLPSERRTAHYCCCAAVSDPLGNIRAQSEGRCRGRIRFVPAGEGGFGYDPLFEIVEYHTTFGLLAPSVKRAISHRSRAMRQLVPELIRLRDGIESRT